MIILKIENPITKQPILFNQMIYNYSLNPKVHFSMLCLKVNKWMVENYF